MQDESTPVKKKAANYAVPAVERTIRILHFLRDRRSASVSEMSNELQITRSNCFAILKTLQNHNFLQFDEATKKYSLGMGLIDVTRFMARDVGVVHVVRPWLARIVDRTGLSALFAQRISDNRLMVLDQEQTTNDIRLTVSIGRRIPITYRATGRAVLAFLPDADIKRLVANNRLIPSTSKTLADPDRILADVALIRERGFSTADEESMDGVMALGAPVFNEMGEPAFAVTILGIAAAIQRRRIDDLGRELCGFAAQITSSIGGRLPAEA